MSTCFELPHAAARAGRPTIDHLSWLADASLVGHLSGGSSHHAASNAPYGLQILKNPVESPVLIAAAAIIVIAIHFFQALFPWVSWKLL